MEHLNYFTDLFKFLIWCVHPLIECTGQFGSDLFAGNLFDVFEWLEQHLQKKQFDFIILRNFVRSTFG